MEKINNRNEMVIELISTYTKSMMALVEADIWKLNELQDPNYRDHVESIIAEKAEEIVDNRDDIGELWEEIRDMDPEDQDLALYDTANSDSLQAYIDSAFENDDWAGEEEEEEEEEEDC